MNLVNSFASTGPLTLTGGNSNLTINDSGSNTIILSGFLGAGKLLSTGDTRITASKDANYTLSNNLITSNTGLSLTLSNVTAADLTATGGGHTFTVSGWTQSGSLTGTGSDTVIVSKAAGFTLSDTLLTATDGLSMILSGITTANLTHTGGGSDALDAAGWTGTLNLVNSGGTLAITGANTFTGSVAINGARWPFPATAIWERAPWRSASMAARSGRWLRSPAAAASR